MATDRASCHKANVRSSNGTVLWCQGGSTAGLPFVALLREFGEPFSRIPGLEDKPHEGDTLNAATYLEVAKTIEKLKAFDPSIAAMLVEGAGLGATYSIKLE